MFNTKEEASVAQYKDLTPQQMMEHGFGLFDGQSIASHTLREGVKKKEEKL